MKHFLVRILNMIAGLVLYAVGIVLTLKANIGYAPWDVFHAGLANKTGMSFGFASIIAGIFIVIVVTVLREKLGLGTILNMVLIGIIIDIISPYIPIAPNKIISYITLISGLFVISLGSYFYIKSAFGVGPRDNLMIVLARMTKLPAGLCRFAVELFVTVIGWFLDGKVGAGTVISAFAIGLCIQVTFKIFRFDVTAVKHENLRDTFIAIMGKFQGKT